MSDKDSDARDLGRNIRAFLDGFLERRRPDGPGPGNSPLGSTSPFPKAGIDGFLSHFVFTIRINKGPHAGELLTTTWPVAIQTVARTDPFIYRKSSNQSFEFPLPNGSQLPREVAEKDFLTTPPGFFEEGKETIFLQILNLDARGDTSYGRMRCILGETFKREYPDIFQPSFGAAQSLGDTGLPAKIFFVPNGIFETPFGALHTRPKNLLGRFITSVPPIGSSPELLEPIHLDSVDELRANRAALPVAPAATILGLAHPIDAAVVGENLFQDVERSIARKA